MAAGATERRGDYLHFHAITTIDAGGLDIRDGPVIGLAVESMCRFHQPLAILQPQ